MSHHVYEALADSLASTGTRAVFGLMGEDTASLISDLERVDIAYYAAEHENVAVSMADGYAWATGAVGVALISRGPGLTNGSTGFLTASKGRRRVLVISGDSATVAQADPKRISQQGLAESIGLEFVRASSADAVVAAFRKAYDSAAVGRPTLFSIPANLFAAACAPVLDDWTPAEQPEAVAGPEPSPGDLDELCELLAASERPLLIVGRGAMVEGSAPVFEELAQKTGALVGTTLIAKSFFRGFAFDAGVVGGFSTHTTRRLAGQADCVIAFGASLNGFTRAHGSIFDDAKIAQVDSDPAAIGAGGRVDLGVVADALGTARQLLERLPARNGAPFHSAEVAAQLAEPEIFVEDESTPEHADPRTLAAMFEELLPLDRVAVTDGGHHFGFPATAISVLEPGEFRITADASAVGMGFGVAMGAAVGRPGRTTALFIGDGGLLMTLGDLATAARYRLPLVIAVANDRAYGAELHFLDLEGLPPHSAEFPDTDFAAVAAAMGIESVTVRSAEDLRAAGGRLTRTDSPILLDCKINPAVRAQWLEDLDAFRKRLFAASAAKA